MPSAFCVKTYTVTPEMLSQLMVNDTALDFSGSGNATITMGGT
jgi:hypothetical protein